MIIEKIWVNNFGVFGEDVKIDFTQYSTNDKVLVIGENNDAAGADSNGAGKTTLLNAISWAIFGRTPSDISSGDIVRRGMGACEVRIHLLDSDNKEIVIIRKRGVEGKHELQWFIDKEPQTERTMKSTQKNLLNYFGILENNTEYYNDFLNTTYFSIDAVKAFAGKKSTSRDRMDLIGRFLNLELLDKCTSKAKVYSNNIKSKLNTVTGQLEFLQNKLDAEEDIQILKSEINDSKVQIKTYQHDNKELKREVEAISKVKVIHEQLIDINSMITRSQLDLETITIMFQEQEKDFKEKLSKRDEIKQNIENQEQILVSKNVLDLPPKINKLEQFLFESQSKITQLEQSIKNTQAQLVNSLNCPDCEAPLMFRNGELTSMDKKVLKKQENDLSTQLSQASDIFKKEQVQLKKLEDRIQAHRDLEVKVKYLYKELAGLNEIPEKLTLLEKEKKIKCSSATEYIKTLSKKKLALELQIKKFPHSDLSLYNDLVTTIEVNEKALENLRDTIARNQTRIEVFNKDIEALDKLKLKENELLAQFADYQFWVEGFPFIRRWMIESFLPSFEEQTNSYLNKMEVGMRVRFDTLKEKKSKKGEFKEEFDLSIIDEFNQKRDLETYSGGESKRIGICVGFALRELTLNKGYSNFNFLLMDEIIDSLDETGINEFFNLLNDITGLKLLITHNSDLKSRFSSVIRITKTDGQSTVIQT
jgi:DNA repair exonuclease SbcCD ATPase subunit